MFDYVVCPQNMVMNKEKMCIMQCRTMQTLGLVFSGLSCMDMFDCLNAKFGTLENVV